jgi:hypothetical protein
MWRRAFWYNFTNLLEGSCAAIFVVENRGNTLLRNVVAIYRTTRLPNAEDSNLYSQRCENFKPSLYL